MLEYLKNNITAIWTWQDLTGEHFVFIASIASIAGLLIPVLLFFLYFLTGVLISHKSRIRELKSGLYIGERRDLIKNKTYWDYINVRYRLGKFRGRSIYSTTNDHSYKLSGKKTTHDYPMISGSWQNIQRSSVQGMFQLHFHPQTRKLKGVWLGPSKNNIHCGVWDLESSGLGYFNWFSFSRRKFRYLRKKWEFLGKDVLGEIIRKHHDCDNTTFQIKGVRLNVANTFNPRLGKISVSLLEAAESSCGIPKSVLDIGCGSGFYGIYFAKQGTESAVCIDVDETAVSVAKANATTNGVAHKIQFIQNSKTRGIYADLSIGDKYDLIIANIPFTNHNLATKHRKSKYFDSFAGHEKTWFDIILGSRHFLNPNGKLIFSFGETGLVESLDHFIKISGFKRTLLDTIKTSDEKFQIIELSGIK